MGAEGRGFESLCPDQRKPQTFQWIWPIPATYLFFPTTAVRLNLLVGEESEEEVTSAFDSLRWEEWITALGPKGWETLCLGYLILEHGFLPTGMSVGGTLADVDIVGRLRLGELGMRNAKET